MPRDQIRRYQSGAFPFEVDVYVDTYEGPAWVKRLVRGRRGWLRVSRATMSTPISEWQGRLVAAVTDDHIRLGPFTASAFFTMRSSDPREVPDAPSDELDAVSDNLMWDFLGTCDIRHLKMLTEAERDTDARVALEQARGERVLADADHHIAVLRRQLRNPDTTAARRSQLSQTIAFFEEKESAAAAWLVRHLAEIRRERDSYEADVFEALENHGEVEELFTARWVARHHADVTVKERHIRDEAMAWSVSAAIGSLHDRLPLSEVGFDYPRMRSMPKGIPPALPKARGADLRRSKMAKRPLDELAALVSRGTEPPAQPARSSAQAKHTPLPISLAERSDALSLAQRLSAARLTQLRRTEADIARLIAELPTVALLDARLDKVPSTGAKNRRLARLIRAAIGRLSGKAKPPVAEQEDDA